MPSASFRFGPNAKHKVSIECDYFGSEKYYVDGILVLNHWSLRPRVVRAFKFIGYVIQITVAVGMTAAYGEAFVDGECVATDLFAEFNAQLPNFRVNQSSSNYSKSDDGMPFVSKCGVWLLCVLAIFLALQYFDQS